MLHKHHIIPKHMGGIDDPSNIELVTVKEHAERHRVLYEQFNQIKDKVAWLGLTKQINKAEINYILQFEGGKKGGKIVKEKCLGFFSLTDEERRKNSKKGTQNSPSFRKGNIPWNKGKELSNEHKRKLGLLSKGRKYTEEEKKKKSECMKNYYKQNPKPVSSND